MKKVKASSTSLVSEMLTSGDLCTERMTNIFTKSLNKVPKDWEQLSEETIEG